MYQKHKPTFLLNSKKICIITLIIHYVELEDFSGFLLFELKILLTFYPSIMHLNPAIDKPFFQGASLCDYHLTEECGIGLT